MADYSIGLSGLRVAQRAIEIVGTNIANVTTEGYHRQEPRMAALEQRVAEGSIVGGVEIIKVRRRIDELLEREILREQPLGGQVAQELSTLTSVEAVLGEMGVDDLTASLVAFFSAMRELASQPNSQALREQAAWAADGLTQQLRSLATFLDNLKQHINLQAEEMCGEINALTSEIADLNDEIYILEVRGGSANLLLDRRDQAIMQLAELSQVESTIQAEEYGIKNVMAWGTPLVTGGYVTQLEVGLDGNGLLGVGVAGSDFYNSSLRGGRLGGLLSLRNELIPDIEDRLDTLASEIITQINVLHVQGVGTDGSFSALTGWSVNDDLAQWQAPVTDGDLYLRIVNQATGQVQQLSVAIDSSQSLTQIAADIDALDANLNVWVADSALRFQAAAGYEFDFLPAPVLDLTTNPWTGTSQPTAGGIYSGSANEEFTFTIVGTGNPGDSAQVGVTDDLAVQVKNGSGEVITVLRLDSGYTPDEVLELENGLKLSLTSGTVKLGEEFTVQALASSDTSGLLAGAGINAFFAGNSAATIAVSDEIIQSPGRIATGIGAEMTDNVNVLRMSDLQDQGLAGLGGVTPVEYYRRLATRVGQNVAARQTRHDSLQNVMDALLRRRNDVGGVDVNQEAASLLMFERMFQAMAKHINAQDKSIQLLMELI